MSAAAHKMSLALAQKLATLIKTELAPACERIEIAGSIRRRFHQISDIEIVAIPQRHYDLLGADLDARTRLDDVLDGLVRQGKMVRLKNGSRYKQFELVKSGVRVDLFLCTPETWAVCLMIRTGPADFSRQFVMKKTQLVDGRRGFLEPYMSIGNGTPEGSNRLYAHGEALECASEEELFKLVGVKWLEPWERR